ncbi:DUF6516 family protein [Methylobacterium sp. SyP6R]|nr:DUF6516 family protein [Methylobacterium sp. SyP6R]MCF4125532.1 DUF6516 family protein [Methylobacterium sp. SyP6R]
MLGRWYDTFAELVVWRVPRPVVGSGHSFKYRLALIVEERCVLRYGNEAGKGDHKHIGADELPFAFTGVNNLLAAFWRDVEAWRRPR